MARWHCPARCPYGPPARETASRSASVGCRTSGRPQSPTTRKSAARSLRRKPGGRRPHPGIPDRWCKNRWRQSVKKRYLSAGVAGASDRCKRTTCQSAPPRHVWPKYRASNSAADPADGPDVRSARHCVDGGGVRCPAQQSNVSAARSGWMVHLRPKRREPIR
jgi:hypothetical protein